MRGLSATTNSIVETARPIHPTTSSIVDTQCEMQPSKNLKNYGSPTDQKWNARRQRRIRSKMTAIQIRVEVELVLNNNIKFD